MADSLEHNAAKGRACAALYIHNTTHRMSECLRFYAGLQYSTCFIQYSTVCLQYSTVGSGRMGRRATACGRARLACSRLQRALPLLKRLPAHRASAMSSAEDLATRLPAHAIWSPLRYVTSVSLSTVSHLPRDASISHLQYLTHVHSTVPPCTNVSHLHLAHMVSSHNKYSTNPADAQCTIQNSTVQHSTLHTEL